MSQAIDNDVRPAIEAVPVHNNDRQIMAALQSEAIDLMTTLQLVDNDQRPDVIAISANEVTEQEILELPIAIEELFSSTADKPEVHEVSILITPALALGAPKSITISKLPKQDLDLGQLIGRHADEMPNPAPIESYVSNLDAVDNEEALDTASLDTELSTLSINDEADILLADLEPAFKKVETEYIGELIFNILRGDYAEEEKSEKHAALLSFISPELTGIVSEYAPPFTSLELVEEPEADAIDAENDFNILIESLDTEQLEAAEAIIKRVKDVLQDIQLQIEETTIEDIVITEQKLEKYCRELLETLGIEVDEETIKRFISSLKKESEPFASAETIDLSIDRLNYLGTREYKPLDNTSLLAGLTRLIGQKFQAHLFVGKYALEELQAAL